MSGRIERVSDWEPTLRVFATPAVIDIPLGDEWQISQVLAPLPPGWEKERASRPDGVITDPEQWPDRGLVVLEADGPGMLVGSYGQEITEASGHLPPVICALGVSSLRTAAWRLEKLDSKLHVGNAHRLLGWIEDNLRERGPSVPGLAALEEALHLARIAWTSYREEVLRNVMMGLPFAVSAEKRPRKITIRRVPMLLGGGPGFDLPELPSIQVEIAAYVKTSGSAFSR